MSRYQDYERDYKRLKSAERAMGNMSTREHPEAVFRTVDMYVHRKYRDAEHLVPESVRNWEHGSIFKVFAPVFDIERADDPIRMIHGLEMTLGVPRYESTKGRKVEYTFKAAKFIEFDRRTNSRELMDIVNRSAVFLKEEYQSWAIKEYLGVADACLHTWDEEILHSDTGKAYNLLRGDDT